MTNIRSNKCFSIPLTNLYIKICVKNLKEQTSDNCKIAISVKVTQTNVKQIKVIHDSKSCGNVGRKKLLLHPKYLLEHET